MGERTRGAYLGWAKSGDRWRVVSVGDSVAETMRYLLDWIGQQVRPPVASAVLPAGVRPERQGGAGDAPGW